MQFARYLITDHKRKGGRKKRWKKREKKDKENNNDERRGKRGRHLAVATTPVVPFKTRTCRAQFIGTVGCVNNNG